MAKGKGIKPEEKIPPAPAPRVITQQKFIDEYNALCKRTGWTITGHPALKPMNDLGGCMITVQFTVEPFQNGKK